MSSLSNELGLSRDELVKHIRKELDKNADLLIGVDDPEMNLLIDVLVEAMGKVMDENNRKIKKDITDWLNRSF